MEHKKRENGEGKGTGKEEGKLNKGGVEGSHTYVPRL
jgi:hypothetical protein